jgi:hypothetical protein
MLILSSLSGCATIDATIATAYNSRGQGKSRIYNASFNTVWNTVPKAVNTLGLTVAGKRCYAPRLHQNQEEGYILAFKGISGFSWGENVAVFVEKVDSERTKVEVVSKKAVSSNITARNWEKPILDNLSGLLASKQ